MLADGPVESGMGMSIIRAIVDELEVEQGDDGRGTVVRMVKYLTPAGVERLARRLSLGASARPAARDRAS